MSDVLVRDQPLDSHDDVQCHRSHLNLSQSVIADLMNTPNGRDFEWLGDGNICGRMLVVDDNSDDSTFVECKT